MNKAGLSIVLVMLGLVGCSNHPAPEEQLRLTRDYFDALAAGVSPELPAAA